MNRPFQWFDCFGIEIEYMIVDARTLDVRPWADRLLRDENNDVISELVQSEVNWSNELLAHVIELKTSQPVASLRPLAVQFQQQVQVINQRLNAWDACLMPTGMHPWMNPEKEKVLWPHEHHEVYHCFDRIFDCSGHGWANLQSMHINLPFADEHQFRLLHSAIRLLLPLLPALSASTPIVEQRVTGLVDNRMEFYRLNSRRIPAVAGQVVPELVQSPDDYQEVILTPIYEALAPLDPTGILQHEWCNSRGAIARFDRNAIEIRVLDAQECPAMDLAIAQLVVCVLKEMLTRPELLWEESATADQQLLAELLIDCIRSGRQAVIEIPQLLRVFDWNSDSCTAGEFWEARLQQHYNTLDPEVVVALQVIVQQGNLAERILKGLSLPGQNLPKVYRELCDCLAEGRAFLPERLH